MADRGWVAGMEGLMRHLPAFGLKTVQFPRSPAEFMPDYGLKYGDLAQGRMVHVANWSEIAARHSRALAGKITYLTISAVAGVAMIVGLMYLAATGSPTWALVSMFAGAACGFYYRHALGVYARFAKYEDMPVMVPILSLKSTVKKTPLEYVRF